MALYNDSGMHAAAQDDNTAALLSKNNDGAAYQYHYFGAPTTEGRDERGAAHVFSTAAHRQNDAAAAAYLNYPGARDGAKDDAGGAGYQDHYFGMPTTEVRDEHGVAYVFAAERTGDHRKNDDGAVRLYYPGAHDGAKDDTGGAGYQDHYFGMPTTEVRDDHGAAYDFAAERTGAHRKSDDGAARLYYGARDGAKDDAGQYHYFGAPTTKVRDDHSAAHVFSGARTAMTQIDGGARDLYPDAHTAAPTKNGVPYIFFGVPTAAQTKDNAACLYPSVHADAASQVKNGAPVIFPDVRAAAQNNNVTVYIDGNMPAAGKNRRGAAAEKGDVDFLDLSRAPGFAAGRGEMLPYQTQTAAAAYYNSGVVAGDALPLASQAFGGKTTSGAVAVGQDKDKVAGAFTEGLRRGLPAVIGLSLASLAVTELAAGEPTQAGGFGLFVMLIVGLFLYAVTIRALRA